MPGPLGPMGFFTYTSDDGNDYTVHLNAAIAAAGGFTPSTSTLSNYPRGWKMRHCYGEQTDGTRISVPINSPDYGLFAGVGASVTIHGQSYEFAGGIGEKRPKA